MRLRSASIVFWSILSLIVFPSEEYACSCNVRPPVCYEYWRTDAIFVGTVTNVHRPETTPFESVEVKVDESFFGMDQKSAMTFNYGHSCAFTFSVGRTYLFYAGLNEKEPSEFGTGFCTRTTSKGLATFAEDLNFLRAVKSGETQFWIWGTISSLGYHDPLPGIKAEILGSKPRISGISNSLGDIKLKVANPGKYRVRIHLPPGRTDINGLVRNDIKIWQEQRKQIIGGRLKGKSPYVDYEVNVESNRCGWFDVSIAPEKIR